jgi:small subunit ribosomal protein S5
VKQLLSRIDPTELTLTDKLIYVNRVSKVVTGGKRLGFSALVVTGDGEGHVGIGIGKAGEVPEAISKGGAIAKKNLLEVPLADTTIPHAITVKFGAAKVLLKPAARGTGIISGGSMRAVLEASGIKDILTKSFGSSNKINIARATMFALSQLKDPKEAIARRMSTKVEEAGSDV